MKRIALACILFSPLAAYAASPDYAFNNSDQQYAVEKAVYQEVIEQIKDSKCTSNVQTYIPDSFIVNLNRYVDVEVALYKNKKYISTISQKVTYENFSKFQYSLFQIVTAKCK